LVLKQNRKVVGLWSNNEPQNSWAYMQGENINDGWKKCRTGDSNAVTNMAIILAYAKSSGAIIDYDEEPEGQIAKVYVR
jgi:hypothetical protein